MSEFPWNADEDGDDFDEGDTPSKFTDLVAGERAHVCAYLFIKDDLTDAEKIERFDELRKSLEEMYTLEARGEMKDFRNYVMEQALELCFAEDDKTAEFWDSFNKLCDEVDR